MVDTGIRVNPNRYIGVARPYTGIGTKTRVARTYFYSGAVRSGIYNRTTRTGVYIGTARITY